MNYNLLHMYIGIMIQNWGQHEWHCAEKHYYKKWMQLWDWDKHLNIQGGIMAFEKEGGLMVIKNWNKSWILFIPQL
jgi:hypothetical protein